MDNQIENNNENTNINSLDNQNISQMESQNVSSSESQNVSPMGNQNFNQVNNQEVSQVNYPNNNKKKISLPIKIILIGCLIGAVVACVGIYKQLDSKRVNKERQEEALKLSEAAVNKANARLAEISQEYQELKPKLDAKNFECDSIPQGTDDWYAKINACHSEVAELQKQISALQMEDAAIKNADYTGYYKEVKPMEYLIFYIIGGSIAGLALLGAFIIYLVKGKKSY